MRARMMTLAAVLLLHAAPALLFAPGPPALGGGVGCARGGAQVLALRMHGAPDQQHRRALLAAAAAAAVSAAATPASAEKRRKPSGGLVGENPDAAQDLFTAKFQQGINKRTSRLFGCQTQTNCVSTAAGKNPTQFVAPWDYTIKTSDPGKAFAALTEVVLNDDTLKIVEVDDQRMYLHATGKSKVPKDGVDDVEFLMVPDEKIVTTRSASRGNFYVYPYQVPIGDGGFQKQRLQGILSKLGWVELNYNGNGV